MPATRVQGFAPWKPRAATLAVHVEVTAAQQEGFNLSTAPPKTTDRRRFDLNFTVQAEALDPFDLSALLREAIESELDMNQHRSAKAWQENVREQLTTAVADLELEAAADG
jgi:hypothetical protein